MRTTSYRNHKCNSNIILKSASNNYYRLQTYSIIFQKKNYIAHKFPKEIKPGLIRNFFYQSNIERPLHLKSDDCKNELLRLNLTRNRKSNRKILNFQVFADSVHQAELVRYQGHIKLDERYPYKGAHGRLTYDIHDKHWIAHIGINNPSNC